MESGTVNRFLVLNMIFVSFNLPDLNYIARANEGQFPLLHTIALKVR